MPAIHKFIYYCRELVIDKDEGKCIDISSDEEYKERLTNKDKYMLNYSLLIVLMNNSLLLHLGSKSFIRNVSIFLAMMSFREYLSKRTNTFNYHYTHVHHVSWSKLLTTIISSCSTKELIKRELDDESEISSDDASQIMETR